MKRLLIALAVVLGCFLCTAPAHADFLQFGTQNQGFNGFPFAGPFDGNPGTRYQQVYNSALFPNNQILISQITFYHNNTDA